LTGLKAFDGNNITEIFGKHFHHTPPLISTVTNRLLPRELEECIAKMMNADRAARYQNITMVRDVLANLTFTS
jgi:hypothetical protein